jgi:ribosomal protein S18 acetylase RimI-like enzyme
MQTCDGWAVRQATDADEGSLRELIDGARRVMLRGDSDDLASSLAQEPFLLVEEQGRLRGFLACRAPWPPHARLAAAGLADDCSVSSWLDRALPQCLSHLRSRELTALSYVGPSTWLSKSLLERGFRLLSQIVSYEKGDLSIPHVGNQLVEVRPAEYDDFDALVAMDAISFHALWRNSVETLTLWKQTLPFFVVALLGSTPVGYCYCSIDEPGQGHLVRMAVHPTWQGHGIGTRLVSEALDEFRRAGAQRITLNTQEENKRAQWLYRRFGFQLMGREAVALWKDL